MTPQQLAELASAFEEKPSFEFLSPEASTGYPADLYALDVSEIQKMIARSEEYAAEVRALRETDEAAPTETSAEPPTSA